MENDFLKQFDLSFTSHWIDWSNRKWASKKENQKWASENYHVLFLIENLFTEAVAAYSLFRPLTIEDYQEHIDSNPSRYESCLNGIYAKAFVFALDGIGKLLFKLCDQLSPPDLVNELCNEYSKLFGHLKHIRDSAIHIEDRGRGKNRHQKPINSSIIICGSFIERRFAFTGENGKQYEVEISDTTLFEVKRIIQEAINSYQWIPTIKYIIP